MDTYCRDLVVMSLTKTWIRIGSWFIYLAYTNKLQLLKISSLTSSAIESALELELEFLRDRLA
jgi:hypothetical protein